MSYLLSIDNGDTHMTNPITAAVMPLKSDAILRADKEARALIGRVHAKLAEHNWDLDIAAPRPNGNMGKAEYRKLMGRHKLYEYITDPTWSTRSLRDPNTRRASPEREARFIKNAVEEAAAQYDAFVAKLIHKIGDCDAASLAGSHVWGYSILTVTKGSATERWQTQQIVNQSVHGKIFNQWPSRRLKR